MRSRNRGFPSEALGTPSVAGWEASKISNNPGS